MSKGKIIPKNILKHNTKKNNNKINLENILEKSNTDNVSDALKNITGKQGIINKIKPINSESKIVGKITTVNTNSYDWGTCIKAIYTAEPGDILLINCSNSEHAVWGELASKAAKKHGLKGTVINGASRDTEDILKSDYPVFSIETKSNAGLATNNGTINERLIINDTIICPGDILLGDSDGVVIIEKEKVEKVLEEVNNIKTFESNCIKEVIQNHKQLDDILNIN